MYISKVFKAEDQKKTPSEKIKWTETETMETCERKRTAHQMRLEQQKKVDKIERMEIQSKVFGVFSAIFSLRMRLFGSFVHLIQCALICFFSLNWLCPSISLSVWVSSIFVDFFHPCDYCCWRCDSEVANELHPIFRDFFPLHL